ncbi:MAG TPA: T9SS type A sorting domain-containing protein [Candidatus Kapabacteria bacterium]|nr:T9SS type A sorting domain-containing protein [Candidatus Kapabacteria bacterium]
MLKKLLPLLYSFIVLTGDTVPVRAQYWDPVFNFQGFYRGVNELAWKGDTLFAAGDFFTAGGKKAYGVAYRIDDRWIPLPNGVDMYGYINTMKIIGNDLYIGGEFGSVNRQPAGSIARYSLTDHKWSMLDGGVATSNFRPVVHELEFDGRYLYVGGEFDTVGGNIIARNVARWDTREDQWSSVTDIIGEETEVYDMLLHEDTLFIGGIFREVGGISTNGLVAVDLNDNSVKSLSDGFFSYYTDGSSQIQALALMNGELYAGGQIDTLKGIGRVGNVIKRHGNSWMQVGEGLWPGVYHLDVYKDHLLAFGHTRPGFEGTSGHYFAYFDGNMWHHPSEHYLPRSFLTRGDELIAAGAFWIDSNYGHSVARFSPIDSTWIPLDDRRTGGPLSSPYKMAAVGDHVFISGHYRRDYPWSDDFNGVDFIATIEEWDGRQWNTLFHQGGYDEHALASDGRYLYTLGREGAVRDGRSAFSLRVYDPATKRWGDIAELVLVGSSTPEMVFAYGSLFIGAGALLPDSTELHTAIQFDLNSRQLKPLGDLRLDKNGFVSTIGVWRTKVVVGGSFDLFGAKNIAAFDLQTNTWHPIGSCDSLIGSVISLETYKNDLVVGGYFREVCGKPAGFIARWDGNEWDDLAGGFDENWYMTSIEDLHANGNDLYASGYFHSANGDSINHIARFDGWKWHAVDETSIDREIGTNERVNRVLTIDNDVYIGGYFSTAGDLASDKFAVWRGGKSRVKGFATRAPRLLVSNPVRDHLELTLPDDGRWVIEVYDILGRLMYEASCDNTHSVSLRLPPSLVSGTYIARASSNELTISATFIKR